MEAKHSIEHNCCASDLQQHLDLAQVDAAGPPQAGTQVSHGQDRAKRHGKRAKAPNTCSKLSNPQHSDSATISISGGESLRGRRSASPSSACPKRARATTVFAEQDGRRLEAKTKQVSEERIDSAPLPPPANFTLANAARAAGIWNSVAARPRIERLPTMSSAADATETPTKRMEMQPLAVTSAACPLPSATATAAFPHSHRTDASAQHYLPAPAISADARHQQPWGAIDILAHLTTFRNASEPQGSRPRSSDDRNTEPVSDLSGRIEQFLPPDLSPSVADALIMLLMLGRRHATQHAAHRHLGSISHTAEDRSADPSSHSAATCAAPSGIGSASHTDNTPQAQDTMLAKSIQAASESKAQQGTSATTWDLDLSLGSDRPMFVPISPTERKEAATGATEEAAAAAAAFSRSNALTPQAALQQMRGAAISAGSGRSKRRRSTSATAPVAHNLVAPINSRLTAVATPQDVSASTGVIGTAQGTPASTSLFNSAWGSPGRLYFPERPRIMPGSSAPAGIFRPHSSASGGSGTSALRAMPLTPETRAACAQNLLAERLTLGPKAVALASASPATRAASGAPCPSPTCATPSTAVPLSSRMGATVLGHSLSSAAPSDGEMKGPENCHSPPEVLDYLALVAQVSVLGDGGMYGKWCSVLEEPQTVGARAVYRKALEYYEMGIRPTLLAPLLKQQVKRLQI